MKSEVIKNKQKVSKYPYLKKWELGNQLLIVLFNGVGSGMVVDSKNYEDRPLGEYRTDWLENTFKPFEDEVRLSN